MRDGRGLEGLVADFARERGEQLDFVDTFGGRIHRALETLEGEHILEDEEMAGARKVLRAAALTYVAALLSSLLQLLRYVLIFLNRSGNRRGGRR